MSSSRTPLPFPTALTLALAAQLALPAALHAGEPPPPPPPIYGYHCDGAVFPLLPDIYSGLHGTMEAFAFTGHEGAVPSYPGNEALLLFGSEDRVVLSEGSILSRRPSSSVSAWFLGGSGGTSQYPIYSERDSCDFNVFWVGMEARPGHLPGLTFGIFDEALGGCGFGTWHVIESGIVPTPGVWHHVAAVLDETSGMSLWLDGVPVGSLPSTATYAGAGEGLSTLGHMHVPSYDGYWPGKLDDIGLFPFALTPPEIMWLATHSLADLPPRSYDLFCLGDGSGTACPCGNESPSPEEVGCENSTGQGGGLRAAGNASVDADTLTLAAYWVPTSTSGVFIQGTGQAGGGAGVVFGDGLMCVGGTIMRLAGVSAVNGVAYYPHPGDAPLSVRGAIPPGGATRHYQFWYRNQAAAFCPTARFNLTNGVTVVWTP
jgi:hypothetical protein